MFDEVIFFNHFGNGDLHESREFVKDLMKILPAKAYKYAHGKSKKVLADLEGIEQVDVDERMDARRDITILGNTLLFNTWIGRDSQYVLPGIGCTLDNHHRMYNDMLRAKRLGNLSFDPINYLPNIDFRYYDVHNIDDYVKNYEHLNVLVCNGNVQSCQAFNFSFTPVVAELAKEYRELNFILTEKVKIDLPNVKFTDDIIRSSDPCDLNEISYLSVFCPLIVGRSSGPFLFCQTKVNWMMADKTFLSFTYTREGATIVNTLPVCAKKEWSSAVTNQGVYKDFKGVIERCRIP